MQAIILLLATLSLSTFAQESAFDETQPLSAQDEHQAENYIHQGLADKEYLEMCEGNMDCTSKDAFSGGAWATVDKMMPMVSQMYAMFSGLSGGKMTATVIENDKPVKVGANQQEFRPDQNGVYKDAKGQEVSKEQLDKSADKTEQKTDICGYIPMVTEPAAALYQQTQNETTQQNYQSSEPEARQKASMYALSKVHDDRSKAAKYQFYGWGATAGCYAAYLASPTGVADWQTSAKLGAASFLAYFYNKKKNAHEEKSDALKEMADKLPGAGDCNPLTDTSCFCAEKTSYGVDPTNYVKYCVSEQLKRVGDIAGVPCVTADGKPDPKCDCKAKNTCINAKLVQGALNLGLNPAQMKDPLSGLQHLSSGYESGKLAPIAERNLAYARKVLGSIKAKDNVSLANNPKAQALAKELLSAGLPKALAARMAKKAASSTGSLPPSLSGSVASFKPYLSDKKNAISNGSANKMKSGKSVNKSKNSAYKSNPFAPRTKSNRGSTGVEIAEYAQIATREAEITKDKSRPIFDIITHRYKMRAWKEFKDSMQQHLESPEDKQ